MQVGAAGQLIPLQVVSAIPRSLQPSDDDGPRYEIDIILTQIAGLADAKAMAVDHQADEPIPRAVAIALQDR